MINTLRELYGDTLKEDNRLLDFAADGEEGLNKLTENKYDLVIIGIVMPKMSGLEMFEKTRKVGIRQHKVIILTNLRLELGEEKIKALGVDGYYLKSDFTPDQVAELVNKLIDEP
jgi:CheY-like chemotaxis protein